MQNCNDDEYVQRLSMSSRETGFDELKIHVFAHNTFARYCDEECEVFDNTLVHFLRGTHAYLVYFQYCFAHPQSSL